jgi:LysM domain-containing protein
MSKRVRVLIEDIRKSMQAEPGAAFARERMVDVIDMIEVLAGEVDQLRVRADLTAPIKAIYTVQIGDTLSSIAERFGVKDTPWGKGYMRLAVVNRIVDPNRIMPGWILIIPDAKMPPEGFEADQQNIALADAVRTFLQKIGALHHETTTRIEVATFVINDLRNALINFEVRFKTKPAPEPTPVMLACGYGPKLPLGTPEPPLDGKTAAQLALGELRTALSKGEIALSVSKITGIERDEENGTHARLRDLIVKGHSFGQTGSIATLRDLVEAALHLSGRI